MYPNVHSSVIHNSQKEEITQCPSIDEWLNKIWHIHNNNYSAINKILIHATTWTNLKKMCQVKEAQHKSSHIAHCHLYEVSRTGKFRDRNETGGCQRLGGGGYREEQLNGYKVFFSNNENI